MLDEIQEFQCSAKVLFLIHALVCNIEIHPADGSSTHDAPQNQGFVNVQISKVASGLQVIKIVVLRRSINT